MIKVVYETEHNGTVTVTEFVMDDCILRCKGNVGTVLECALDHCINENMALVLQLEGRGAELA